MDIVNSFAFRRLTLAAAITADTTVAAQIDTFGFQGVVALLLNIGTISAADASNTLTVEVWESADDGVADPYVQITEPMRYITPFNTSVSNPHGSGPFVIAATPLSDTDHIFGVSIGVKRYLEVRFNEANTFSAVLTLNCLLGGARSKPVKENQT